MIRILFFLLPALLFSWVKPYDFPLEPVPLKETQVNLQILLLDTQRNWEEKTLYRHYVIKPLTQRGIEDISQLSIDYDPATTKVVMHQIQVYRDGQWTDRLNSSRTNTVQRETRLEENLYDGDLTQIYFIEDIREGDILEYSYSLIGEHPFFNTHFTEFAYLQRDFAVEKIVYRLLAPPDLTFDIKPINTTTIPQVTDLSPALREWVWEAIDPPIYKFEDDQPAWHNPPAHIELSQYKTWAELAQKVAPLYLLPDDFPEIIPPEMQALVDRWKASTPLLAERALLAIRFVQDEVRYLGIEENIGAIKPVDPRLTFQRRFGDCKDKTQLLHALLKLLDIDSKPMLVHSSRGKRLAHVLPLPQLFNHAVLQLNVDGNTYWVDSTLGMQGGALHSNPFPDYYYGLIVSHETKDLIALPEMTLPQPTEIDASILVESEETALVKLKMSFFGFRADLCRRSLKQTGLKKVAEDNLIDLQKTYGTVTIVEPLEAIDDRPNNIFTYTSSFRIPTEKLSDSTILEVYSHTLRKYLDTHINPERTAPYALSYPLWIKEHIHVENPLLEWETVTEDYKQEHPALAYTLATRIEGHHADFDIELRHLQDHVPIEAIRDYWKTVNDISNQGLPNMTIVDNTVYESDFFPSWIHLAAALAFWPLIYFFLRKREEPLNFYLNRFQQYSLIFTVLGVLMLTDSIEVAVFGIATTGLIYTFVCNRIASKRSLGWIIALQVILLSQAFIIDCVILASEEAGVAQRAFAFGVYTFYLGTLLLQLKKARSHLNFCFGFIS